MIKNNNINKEDEEDVENKENKKKTSKIKTNLMKNEYHF